MQFLDGEVNKVPGLNFDTEVRASVMEVNLSFFGHIEKCYTINVFWLSWSWSHPPALFPPMRNSISSTGILDNLSG
jgi:hypothetical protein